MGSPESVVNDSWRAGIFFRLAASVVFCQVRDPAMRLLAFGSFDLSTPTPRTTENQADR
jgi:hypothetical protein